MITSETVKQTITESRSCMMGIAIILVVLYHATCSNISLGLLTLPSSYGLIGVDIFLFLSAYGISFSINKYSVGVFYRRRYERILPIYSIMMCIRLIISMLCNSGG